MTTDELLTECKKGLSIQEDSTAFDGVLTQKILAVKSFMAGAGVSDTTMDDDLAVGIIVMGAADLWNAGSGEIKFSPLFYTFLGQLAIGSSILTVTSNPLEAAVGVSVAVQPVLTFSKRISLVSNKVSLVNYTTKDPIALTVELDITEKILTIEPNSNLDAATKYGIVINGVTAVTGQGLPYTVIGFTTS